MTPKGPTCLIIGAAKAGTTAVFHYLAQHPDIFGSPVRETNYFALSGSSPNFAGPGDAGTVNRNSISSRERYLAQFEGAGSARVRLEASPLYLYHPMAARRIAAEAPEASLIALLRNPVDRAYASYLHLVRDGREAAATFEAALSMEQDRIAANWEHLWHFRAMGRYAEQIRRYLSACDSNKLHVFLHEDFAADPAGFIHTLYDVLDVAPSFTPDLTRILNPSGRPRSRRLQRWVDGDNPLRTALVRAMPAALRARGRNKLAALNLKKPPLAEETRQRLIDEYRDGIYDLQDLIKRDLSSWLQ